MLVHDATVSLLLWREQFLFSSDAIEELKESISRKNHELVYLYDFNLVDEIWKESRPKPPNKPIRVHDLKYAGVDVSSKLANLRSGLDDSGSSAIVISMLDEIAWLLNLVSFLHPSLYVDIGHLLLKKYMFWNWNTLLTYLAVAAFGFLT